MILVLRALGVGDLATAAPALRGLRHAHPEQAIALAAPPALAPLAVLTGAVDRIVPVDLDDLRPRRFEFRPPRLAVNLHGRGPQSHRLLSGAAADRTYAFACPAAEFTDGPQWQDEEHEVERWCRMLSWYGVETDPHDLDLRRPEPSGRPEVPTGATVIHPGAKAAARRWPPERYAEVARSLAADGHRVVITGTSGEYDACRQIADRAGLPDRAVLAGRTDVGDLAALIANARLVVSGDTGAGHLATAYRTPSVLLFGQVSPGRWGPPEDRPWHRVLWRGERAAEPAPASGPHPALAAIDVEEVLGAVARAEQAAAPAPAR
ncbi:glycosyltransferase family 9 protein [Rhizomonospora bruguierae]|uniref:glycosyltransferase family 9 protein n=1 Tax=Rhizomonospora bruguierae TaxID=1581705 RepID=UPI001BCB43B2|nr:glycosyltransferase family 9 protein [Micromonospora sp. NBRC 107566]